MTDPNEYSQENQEVNSPKEAKDTSEELNTAREDETVTPDIEDTEPKKEIPYQSGRVYSPEAPEGTTFYRMAQQATTQEQPYEPIAQTGYKRKGSFWKSLLALLLAVLMAGGAGYAGAWVYNRGKKTGTVVNRENVVYQSVIRTVGESDNQEDGLSVSDIAEMASPSVVEIVTEQVNYNAFFGQYPTSGAGSGVVFSKEGMIVTNYHVVEDAQTIKVTINTGESFDAKVIGTDEEDDLAVLKIEPGDTELTPALLGSSESLKVGESVVAIGNPLGELGGTVTNGIISALDREVEIDGKKLTLLQTNAAVNPGNSGGGLFNMYGELIGIVNAKITNSGSSTAEGLGFAIPIDHAAPIVEELATYGYVRGRMDIGMEFLEINDATTAMYYNVAKSGVYILSVEDTSLGFQSGDMIEYIDGTEIVTMDQLEAVWDAHEVGDSLSVTVERRVGRNQYQEYTYQLVLKENIPDQIQ